MFRRKNIKKKVLYRNFTQLKEEVEDTKAFMRKIEKNAAFRFHPELQHLQYSIEVYEKFIANGEYVIDSWNEGILGFYDIQELDDESARVFEDLKMLSNSSFFETAAFG